MPHRLALFLALLLFATPLAACGEPAPAPVEDPARFLAAVEAATGQAPAPGFHRYVMLADAYTLCGELDAGRAPADLVAAGIRDGINGNLYPANAVRAMVEQAPRYLGCAR